MDFWIVCWENFNAHELHFKWYLRFIAYKSSYTVYCDAVSKLTYGNSRKRRYLFRQVKSGQPKRANIWYQRWKLYPIPFELLLCILHNGILINNMLGLRRVRWFWKRSKIMAFLRTTAGYFSKKQTSRWCRSFGLHNFW